MTKKAWKKYFNERVTVDENGCWIMPQKPFNNGYIRIRIPGSGDRKAYQGHRLSYEAFIKKIPKGLVLDHLCRVRHCVNPAHLEPVTPKINILRGISPLAKNAKKTHCKHGHELSYENVYRTPQGLRQCKACRLNGNRVRLNQKPRTDIKVFQWNGKKYGLGELSKKYNIKYSTLYSRLYLHRIDLKTALLTPIKKLSK